MNSSVDSVYLFSHATPISSWPQEVLQIGLYDYTHAAQVTATSNFYRPDSIGRDRAGNMFSYTFLTVSANITPSTSMVFEANTYPDILGNALTWDVARDDERGKWEVQYRHPATGYNNELYIWQGQVFPSRVIPLVVSATTTSIEISSVLAAPFFTNNSFDARPWPGTPAATARNVTNRLYAGTLFNVKEYQRMVPSVSPIPSTVYIKYLSGGKTESAGYTATNVTGVAQSSWTKTLTAIDGAYPIVPGTIIAVADFNTTNETYTRQFKDDSPVYGEFYWRDQSSNLRTGVSAGGTTTIDYDTAEMTVTFQPPLYFFPYTQTILSFNYQVSSLNNYALADELFCVNNKVSADNLMSQFYPTSTADHVTLSSGNVPIYMYDIETNLSLDGSTNASPTACGYTISFMPTATVSAVSANVLMISGGYTCNWDPELFLNLAPGYHQVSFQNKNSYSLVKYLTGEITDESSLSAYETTAYRSYLAGTQYLTISAPVTAARFDNVTIVTVSSIDGTVQDIYIPWTINPDNWAMDVKIDRRDNSSAVCHAEIICEQPIDVREIQWGTNPNENVIFRSMKNGAVIPQNTTVAWATASAVSVQNLGIEMTSICVTSITPLNMWAAARAGCTYWSPTSWNDVSFQIRADALTFDNKKYIKTLPLSGLLVKNGLFYSLPITSSISWRSTADPSIIMYGVTGSAVDDQKFLFNTPMNGSIFDRVTASFIAPIKISNPTEYAVSIWGEVYSSYFILSSLPVPTYTIYMDDFPGVNLLSMTVSSNFNSVTSNLGSYNSTRLHDIFVPVSATNLYFEDTSSISPRASASTSTRSWHLSSNQGTFVYQTTGAILDVTLTPTQSSISAVVLSRDYYSDGWRALHTQQLPVYIHFIDNVPTISAVAFPTLLWLSGEATPQTQTIDNFAVSSQGVSAYGNCHSETITISASGPEFTSYRYQFGNMLVASPSATASQVMTCPVATCSATLGVSGYNAVITVDTPLRYYDLSGNYLSLSTTLTSTSSTANRLWQDMTFIDYPALTYSASSVDCPAFALGSYERPVMDFDLFLDVDPIMTLLDCSTFVTIYVGGAVPYSFSYRNPVSLGHNEILVQFQVTDPNNIHYLSDSTSTPITAVIETTHSQEIQHALFNWCPSTTAVTTTLYTTAWPSPIIEFFNSSTVGCIDTPIIVYNATAPTISASEYDELVVDMGDGTVQYIAGSALQLSATYSETGTYYLNVSGKQNGQTISEQVFGPLIIFPQCDDVIDQFNEGTTRKLGDELVLPHTCDDLSVQNEWVTKDVFNSLVEKIDDNLQYVIDSCTMYEPILPLSYIGWYGSWTQSRRNTWNLNTSSKFTYDQAVGLKLNNVKTLAWDPIYDIVHIIKSNQITMHAYDHAMTQISPPEDLPHFDIRGSTLINNKLYIVDAYSNGVYAYDIVPYSATPYRLAQYFADFGDANAKQALNDPNDITNDGQQVFVVDKNNYSIKVYNAGLAWTDQFSHVEFADDVKPISIATSVDYIFVLTSNKTVYRFNPDTYEFVDKWMVNVNAQKIRTYNKQVGFVTILTDNSIVRYTHTGVLVGTLSQPVGQPISDICYDDNYTMLIAGPDKLFAAIDIIATKTIRTTAADDIMWPASQTRIQPSELVTAWVYNSIIKKLWDNIMIVDKSIHSKFVQYSTPTTTDISFAIVTTTSSENVTYDASQLYIGNNELVTSHVVERSFKALCEAIDLLLSRIETDRRFDPCIANLCWTWAALKGTKTPFSPNCQTNPITWFELQDNVPTAFAKRWCDAISANCGCESEVFNGLVLDNAITYLRIGGSVLVMR